MKLPCHLWELSLDWLFWNSFFFIICFNFMQLHFNYIISYFPLLPPNSPINQVLTFFSNSWPLFFMKYCYVHSCICIYKYNPKYISTACSGCTMMLLHACLKCMQFWHWKLCLETRDGLIFCYSHRSVPYSIIREAVFNSRWGQRQRPIDKHQTKKESKWKVSVKSFP